MVQSVSGLTVLRQKFIGTHYHAICQGRPNSWKYLYVHYDSQGNGGIAAGFHTAREVLIFYKAIAN